METADGRGLRTMHEAPPVAQCVQPQSSIQVGCGSAPNRAAGTASALARLPPTLPMLSGLLCIKQVCSILPFVLHGATGSGLAARRCSNMRCALVGRAPCGAAPWRRRLAGIRSYPAGGDSLRFAVQIGSEITLCSGCRGFLRSAGAALRETPTGRRAAAAGWFESSALAFLRGKIVCRGSTGQALPRRLPHASCGCKLLAACSERHCRPRHAEQACTHLPPVTAHTWPLQNEWQWCAHTPPLQTRSRWRAHHSLL